MMGNYGLFNKKKTKLNIPLSLEKIGIRLSNTIKNNKNNSEYVINDDGKKISAKRISKRFSKARDLTNLIWEGTPPSFHEIRSLSARLYTEKNGSEFTRKLLGHKSAEMTAKYKDDRQDSWIEI